MHEQLLAKVNALPPLPESVRQIQLLTAASEVDIKALTRVIEGDPLLAANILRSANSPLYSFTKEVRSIQQAVMLFGVSIIRGFAVAAAIKKSFLLDLSPYGLSPGQFAETSVLQSALMGRWYQTIDPAESKLLQSVAFLMQTGKILVARDLIESHALETFQSAKAESGNLETAEEQSVGINSYLIGAMVFEKWGFEPRFVAYMRCLGSHLRFCDPEIRQGAAALLAVAKAADLTTPLTPEMITQGLALATENGLDPAPFAAACAQFASHPTTHFKEETR